MVPDVKLCTIISLATSCTTCLGGIVHQQVADVHNEVVAVLSCCADREELSYSQAGLRCVCGGTASLPSIFRPSALNIKGWLLWPGLQGWLERQLLNEGMLCDSAYGRIYSALVGLNLHTACWSVLLIFQVHAQARSCVYR
jgi:hypothetical protein